MSYNISEKTNGGENMVDLDEMICFCGSVTAGDIKAAVEAGNTTLEAVKQATGASTHCGGCEPRVEELIEEFK